MASESKYGILTPYANFIADFGLLSLIIIVSILVWIGVLPSPITVILAGVNAQVAAQKETNQELADLKVIISTTGINAKLSHEQLMKMVAYTCQNSSRTGADSKACESYKDLLEGKLDSSEK